MNWLVCMKNKYMQIEYLIKPMRAEIVDWKLNADILNMGSLGFRIKEGIKDLFYVWY